ncbi:hypothetical protein Harman_40320 [Haloarcula mannanilytica]|uniref:Halobacterial output domain-containing protein n=1 Tax=Haloarcula mannanilytica TaxID=2509225 RepID=A0A4C2EQS7_9EURY|nr:HalOD1 output domain-containing protein [Haloarcula mannanilytica]GCF16097.1 hypothetical protein Harman_40320 [Haloarcula mannanilytica]
MKDNSESDDAVGNAGLFAETSENFTEIQYEPSNERGFTSVVVEAIATHTEDGLETLRESPLQSRIDISVIETLLFGSPPDQSTGPATRNATFRYGDVLVTIRADGVIRLADIDGSGDH